MRTLRITLSASQDLDEISDYFLTQSINAGANFVSAFEKKCRHLAQFPYIGKSYEAIRPNLRGLSLMGYIIFYQVNEDSIDIIRVVSGYRNMKNLFGN
ncbi:MAG: type II toxin-antitoxin system RelE/ParE family toxin [Cyanobacteria bacterium P01_C01_bin.89]